MLHPCGATPHYPSLSLFPVVSLSRCLPFHRRYVLQDDRFFPEMTVRETIAFAATLRLPSAMPHNEKMGRVRNSEGGGERSKKSAAL